MEAASPLPNLELPTPADGLKAWTRTGFASIGFVHLVLGGLAAMAALGVRGSNTPNQREVFQAIQHMPLGQVLLWLVAGGLLGYVAWRMAQAFYDTEGKGTTIQGIAVRCFYCFSGLLYGFLAYYAGKLAWYGHLPKAPETGKSTLQQVLHHPHGQAIVALIGLVVLGASAVQLYRAWSGKFDTDVNSSPFTHAQRRLVYHMGQIGYTARGIVLGSMGYFCFLAAQHANGNEIRDTEGCFNAFQAIGPHVLSLVATGLIIYGLYMLVQARFPILRGL
ncbi:DUF1206 domain-containing protein [Hymenobacter taeanensis]|uniref:DUF1206 domain-containing protein n=1 Tax=Hymenobacter taeanensis TaxID=2735321 RepID=A0A6M6BJJ4_9BACT|nr:MULTISPECIES: DUF1206 domain-containing protein [Hymenobacter]QJX47984.1 DUF1206 domain-containing protein [Hymenobacter taeanensis]UOQ82568.1 DUF1206 domain-containing protein [Hymenobacter sp. 5414T-23]